MINIIKFQPSLSPDFARLNYEWLNDLFTVEPHDFEILEAPEEHIISKGGQILFAEFQGEIIGTVALIPEGNGIYELAKMAVAKTHQGKGIGHMLLTEAIKYCNQLAIKKLYLVSNSKLKPAIHLYENHGFVHTPMCDNTPYTRCDVRMEIDFNKEKLY